MRLRTATMNDAAALHRWRNDPATKAASVEQASVEWTSHCDWLRGVLADPRRHLFIAEAGIHRVGTIRADCIARGYELSWTVSPDFRSQGYGSAMLGTAIAQLRGPFVAKIRKENERSIRMVEKAGFWKTGEDEEFIHWRFDPRP